MATQLDNALTAIGFSRAQNDPVRARLLLSIARFAKEIGDEELAEAAKERMPIADPFTPPTNWLEGFCEGFRMQADPDSGTDPDGAHYQGVMLWQMSSDAWRTQRVCDSDKQGFEDGEEEALAQNVVE